MGNKVLYAHKRLDKNTFFYIGIGTVNRPDDKRGRNRIWKGITSRTEYEVIILHKNLSWEKACILERKYIKDYGRIDLGTGILSNMTDGGDGTDGMVITEEHRKKTSQTIKTKIKNGEWVPPTLGKKMPVESVIRRAQHMSETYHPSEEHRKILSEKLKGEGNGMFGKEPWNYGISLSNEHVQKLIDNHKGMSGKTQSTETRKKMSNSNKSRILSESDVLWIRKYHQHRSKGEFGTKAISIKYGVSEGTIKNIIQRRSWKHI